MAKEEVIKYEYLSVRVPAPEYKRSMVYPVRDEVLEKILNKLGGQGWELVNVMSYPISTTFGITSAEMIYTFKRVKGTKTKDDTD